MSVIALAKSMLTAIVVLLLIVVGGLYIMQDRMIFPAPDISGYGDLRIDGFEAVEILTPDGEALAALFHPPEDDTATILFFHGNGDAALFQEETGRALAEAGFGVLLAEYRGYGGSSGQPSEAGLYTDGLASFDFVRQRSEGPIGVYAHSLGTAVAIHVAANRQIFALVLDSPFDSMLALAQRQYPFLPVAPLLKHHFRSDQKIGGITAPIAIRHGTADQVVPIENGRRLLAKAPEGTEFEEIPGAGHNDLTSFGTIQKAISFFRAKLP